MPTITPVPNNGGRGILTVSGHGYGEEAPGNEWTSYLLRAEAYPGFVFSHFEWDWRYTSPSGNESGTSEDGRNPTGGSTGPDWNAGGLTEFEWYYPSDGRMYVHTIRAIRAIFTPDDPSRKYAVSTYSSPEEGGTTTGSGSYNAGSSCSINATPNEGYRFVRWEFSDGSVYTDPTVTFTVNKDESCKAVFEEEEHPRYTVTTLSSPTDGGSTSGGGEYDEGASCTITATPEDGYRFVRWEFSDGTVDTSSSVTFTVDSDVTCTAIFEEEEPPRYTVTTLSSPTEGGTTSGGGEYSSGSTCTVTATPEEGYTFERWEFPNGVEYQNATVSFAVYQDTTCTAKFKKDDVGEKHHVSTVASPSRAGTTSGDGDYDHGATCTVSASEKCSPWTFVEWVLSTGEMSSQKSYTFTVDSDVTCTARFSHSSSGMPYYDADGEGQIVCAQDGSILYDGDQV